MMHGHEKLGPRHRAVKPEFRDLLACREVIR